MTARRPSASWVAVAALQFLLGTASAQTPPPEAPPRDGSGRAEGGAPAPERPAEGAAAAPGVIRPPAGVDPGIHATVPDPTPNTTPVIPPPGTPGGNPRVQPR